MKNFDYLHEIPELEKLYKFCDEAECSHNTNYDVCALNCRRALEWMVRSIYAMKQIQTDSKDSLYTLVSSEPFTEFIDDSRLMLAVHYIRKVGNKAAHQGGIIEKKSYFSLFNLYNFIGGVLLKLQVIDSLAPFDKALIPQNGGMYVIPDDKPMMVAEDDVPKSSPTTRLQQNSHQRLVKHLTIPKKRHANSSLTLCLKKQDGKCRVWMVLSFQAKRA